MKNFLFAISLILLGYGASQARVYEDWQQELLDHMFVYDGVYYSVTSEEDMTAAVFDPDIFVKDSGMYEGDIVIPQEVSREDGNVYTVTEVAKYCFCYCDDLRSVTLPQTVVSLDCVFQGCFSLERISLGDNLEYINDSFNNLPVWETTEFTIPSSVKTLAGSFCELENLKKITLPENPVALGYDFNRTHLETIVCMSVVPYPVDDISFMHTDKSACVVKVPEGFLEEYKAAPIWSEFSNIIEDPTLGVGRITDCDSSDKTPRRIDGKVFRETDRGIYILDGKKHIRP